MFRDNKSVVESSMQVNAKLHKRHTMLSFHRVRETIASGMIGFYFIPGETLILLISSVKIGVIHRFGLISRHFHYGRVILEVSQSEDFEQMGSVKISFVCSSKS
jgi:hypothetical protein